METIAAFDGRASNILFLNGKFYGGREGSPAGLNGVNRVADRLLRELDALAARGDAPAHWDMRLLVPAHGHQAPAFRHIRVVPQRFGHTQAWEQAILPVVARSGALASFANLAPAAHRRQLTMIHDAQFRLSPESYPARLRHGYRVLIPLGAASSRVVVTVSDYARDSLVTFGIANPRRTVVLHNGADHILAADPDPAIVVEHDLAGRRYALVFGSAARYKNLRVVFDAFARAALRDMALVVVGPTRAALSAAGLPVPDRALCVGPVSDGALRALYEGATCFLYPSRTEGFGLPPLEAMLCGCPVVAAPAGAIPEVCGDAVLYAGLDDANDWTAQILRLSDDADLRGAKIASGLARARVFTWRRAGERLAALLTPLVESRQPARGGPAGCPNAGPRAP